MRRARAVRFGGERGETVGVTAGDVVVVPAGVAHALINASDDFLVVGAYAGGRSPDEMRDDGGAIAAARQSIAEVPLPTRPGGRSDWAAHQTLALTKPTTPGHSRGS